jgi:hypothetical protein
MPPKADNEHTTPPAASPFRRVLLTGASAALLAGAAATAVAHAAPAVPAGADGADGELLKLAHEFGAVDAELMRFNAMVVDGDDPAFSAVHDEWREIVDSVEKLPAHTEAGGRAKASLLPAIIRDYADMTEPEVRFTLSLLRDILGQDFPGLEPEQDRQGRTVA